MLVAALEGWMVKSVGMICFVAAALFSGCCSAQTIVLRAESPSSPLTARNAVVRPRAAMSRQPETAEGARIKFWIARAMLEDCLQNILPGPVTWYAMSYTCGPSDGRLADFPFRGSRYKPPSIQTCSQFGNTVTCMGN